VMLLVAEALVVTDFSMDSVVWEPSMTNRRCRFVLAVSRTEGRCYRGAHCSIMMFLVEDPLALSSTCDEILVKVSRDPQLTNLTVSCGLRLLRNVLQGRLHLSCAFPTRYPYCLKGGLIPHLISFVRDGRSVLVESDAQSPPIQIAELSDNPPTKQIAPIDNLQLSMDIRPANLIGKVART
jgi:hypothetical protein